MDAGQAYRTLIETTGMGYLLLDQDGKVIDANQEYARLAGFRTVQEILGKSVVEWTTEEEKDRNRDAIEQCLRDGFIRNFEIVYKGHGGSKTYVDVNATVLGSGPSLRILSLCRDITERKRTEEALRISEEKFSKAFKTSPDSININRLSDGVYIDINDGFTAITGYTREDVIGRSSLPNELGIWVDREDRERLVASLKATGECVGLEAPFRCKDGRVISGIMSARVITIGGEPCILSISRDITQRKKVEEELHKADKLESLGVLAGGIAHDFNNLLGGIFGYVDLALRRSKDPSVSVYLETTLNAMDRARGLTSQLLTFAKGGAPLLKVEPFAPFLCDAVNFALSGSNITCTFAIEPGLWWCNFDRNQMAQVIDNIIINAQHAMPGGGAARVSAVNMGPDTPPPSPLQRGRYVRITITDSGIGIPKEILPRIFEPFFTTKQKGSGLGLASCYSILRHHGGAIDVESEPGKGASFHFYLPAHDEAEVQPSTASAGSHRGSGHVLVMDDEAVIRDTVCRMLNDLGYECVPVQNGREALASFANARETGAPFKAVILDLTIPGESGGMETAVEIRSLDPGVPLFVASGYAKDPVIADPGKYGFTGSLRKPFTTAELAELLRKHLPDTSKS